MSCQQICSWKNVHAKNNILNLGEVDVLNQSDSLWYMTFSELDCEARVMIHSLVSVPTTVFFCKSIGTPNFLFGMLEHCRFISLPLENLFIFHWCILIHVLKQIPKETRAAWQTQKEESVKWTAKNSAQLWKQTTRYLWILSIAASSESHVYSLEKPFVCKTKLRNLHKCSFKFFFLTRECGAMSEFSSSLGKSSLGQSVDWL